MPRVPMRQYPELEVHLISLETGRAESPLQAKSLPHLGAHSQIET